MIRKHQNLATPRKGHRRKGTLMKSEYKEHLKKLKKDSHPYLILKYMMTHKRGITKKEAMIRFDCTNLGGRIFDLRQRGIPIVTDMVPNKHGGEHAEYRLEA